MQYQTYESITTTAVSACFLRQPARKTRRRSNCSAGAIWTPISNIAAVVAASAAVAVVAAAPAPAAKDADQTVRPRAAAQGSGVREGHQVIVSFEPGSPLLRELPARQPSHHIKWMAHACCFAYLQDLCPSGTGRRFLPSRSSNNGAAKKSDTLLHVRKFFSNRGRKKRHGTAVVACSGMLSRLLSLAPPASAPCCAPTKRADYIGAPKHQPRSPQPRRPRPTPLPLFISLPSPDLPHRPMSCLETAGGHRPTFPRQYHPKVSRQRKIQNSHVAGHPGAGNHSTDAGGSHYPRAGLKRPWTAAPHLGSGRGRGGGRGGGGGGDNDDGEQKWWVRLGGRGNGRGNKAVCGGEVEVLGGKLWGYADEVCVLSYCVNLVACPSAPLELAYKVQFFYLRVWLPPMHRKNMFFLSNEEGSCRCS